MSSLGEHTSRRNTVTPKVTVVLPAKNEAANLREVLPRLPAVHEVILVDGDSVDGTIEAARDVLPEVKVVRQTRKGKGNALAAGFLAASGDIIVMFDADGSADPEEIPSFVAALVDGADFAKGSRFIDGGGSKDLTGIRSLGNAGLNTAANLAFGTRSSDLCYGYNAFWRDLVPLLDLPALEAPAPESGMLWGDGFEIEAVINCRMVAAKVEVAEVPSVELLRIHGVSNLHAFSDGFRVLRTILAEYLRMRRNRRLATVIPIERAPSLARPRADLFESVPDDEASVESEQLG